MVILALLLAAADPSAEALALGRQIAEAGTLASVLPLIKAKETEELLGAHPELSDAEKAKLLATADRVFAAGRERLMNATPEAYAQWLSIDDLRAIAAFHSSDAAKRFQSATPAVIAQTMQEVGEMDFQNDVIEAFCAETGKLCRAD